MNDGRGTVADRGEGASFADSDDPVVGAAALLVLGAGLGSLFGVPILDAVDFWIIFVIGYAVVVPLVSLVRGRTDEPTDQGPRRDQVDRTADAERPADASDEDVDAALDRLRDRYARGDLSEAQFERKLEVLLETETPEDARDRVENGNVERDVGERESEREP